jgi:hypothetical protein
MKNSKKTFIATAFLILAATLTGCMAGKQLYPSAAEPTALAGSYTLLLYGCHYPDDITNVAILVSNSSKYPVEIYDIDTSYKVEKDVPAQQALRTADSFLRCTTHRIWQTVLRRIPDDSGGTIGYEVRPLYFPLEFGQPDVLLTSYSLQDGKIRAYIRLDRDVERMINGAPDTDRRNHK